MKINIFILTLLFFAGIDVTAQNINSVMQSVKSNNLELKTAEKHAEAEKLSARTGIYLENPEVEYAHLWGKPGKGNLQGFEISQSFDFPTVYTSQKKLAKLKVHNIDFQLKAKQQEILHNAKIVCIQIVYLNKLIEVLNKRIENAENIMNMLTKKMEVGSANILEVNKAKIQHFNTKTERDLAIVELGNKSLILNSLNGNVPVNYSSKIYEEEYEQINFDSIKSDFEKNDCVLSGLIAEKTISQKNKSVVVAENLPSFSIGFGIEKTPSEYFRGLKVGISIPLWQNKNTIKHAKKKIIVSESKAETYIAAKVSELSQNYNTYLKLKEHLNLSVSLITEMQNEKLLKLALENGEISGLEYFSELMFLYQTEDNQLLIEKELYLAKANMLRYRL